MRQNPGSQLGLGSESLTYPTRINYVLPCLSASAKSLNTFNPPVPLRNFIAVEFLDEKPCKYWMDYVQQSSIFRYQSWCPPVISPDSIPPRSLVPWDEVSWADKMVQISPNPYSPAGKIRSHDLLDIFSIWHLILITANLHRSKTSCLSAFNLYTPWETLI